MSGLSRKYVNSYSGGKEIRAIEILTWNKMILCSIPKNSHYLVIDYGDKGVFHNIPKMI